MSNDHSEEQGQQLRAELDGERRRAGGSYRWWCSDELRFRAVRYAVACSLDGESHGRIGSTLGLTQSTLSRWIRDSAGAGSGFHEVAIVPATHDRSTAPPPSLPLRLLTPRGFVVEGLDPELLVSLLRVLG